MKSNPDTIQIVKEDVDEEGQLYQLYIDGGRRACLRHLKEKVSLYFDVAGDFQWQEAKVFIQGLLKLVELGDKLADDETEVEQLLHEPTEKEIEMAKAKAKAKQAKADKKAKKPGEKKETAATMFQELIMTGNLTDDKIFEKVATKFGLDQKKRSYVAWYRNKLVKDGKKPPATKE
jgi:hypothetical protein